MIFEDVHKYLGEVTEVEGVRPLGKRRDYVLISCPLAAWTHPGGVDRHPSFMVWFGDDKQTYYKCYSCGESGQFWRLFYDIGRHSNDPEVQALALVVLKVDTPTLASKFAKIGNKISRKHEVQDTLFTLSKVIPDRVIDKYELAVLNRISLDYLKSRRVDELTALRFNLRWDKHNYRVCFPVYDEYQTCVGMVGRTVPPGNTSKRYFNYFNFEKSETLGGYNFVNDYEYNKVLVVEGFFDLLSVWHTCMENKILPVCTWNASCSKWQLNVLSRLNCLVLCGYDPDDAGNRGNQKLHSDLTGLGVAAKIVMWPNGNDPGQLAQNEIQKVLFDGTLASKFKV